MTKKSNNPMQKTFLRFLLFGFIASATLFTACKKEGGKSNEEKIVGKWTPEAVYYEYSAGGISEKDTTYATEGEYIQFNSDKTVISFSEGEQSTGTWSIQDNKLTLIGTGEFIAPIYEIQKLTDNELNLHIKQDDDTGSFEMTMHLTK
jgi:hypothetical protein